MSNNFCDRCHRTIRHTGAPGETSLLCECNIGPKNDIHAIPGRIETRLGYSAKARPAKLAQVLTKGSGYLFHRKDYHEDESISDTWGIELTKDEFLAMGGTELSVMPVPDTSNSSRNGS